MRTPEYLKTPGKIIKYSGQINSIMRSYNYDPHLRLMPGSITQSDLMDMLFDAEKIASILRAIAADSNYNISQDEGITPAPIHIEYENEILTLELPPLLPRPKNNAFIMANFVEEALSDYQLKHGRIDFELPGLIVFQHVVSRPSYARDNDNYNTNEQRSIQNAVCKSIMVSDRYSNFSIMNCTKLGEAPGTFVFFVPYSRVEEFTKKLLLKK